MIAKSAENYISVETGCIKVLDSYRLLDASLEKLSTTSTSFSSRDVNGIGDEMFKRNLAYAYEKVQTIESFYELLNLGKDAYFSFLNQSFPDF